jgi:hypothetical protein
MRTIVVIDGIGGERAGIFPAEPAKPSAALHIGSIQD